MILAPSDDTLAHPYKMGECLTGEVRRRLSVEARDIKKIVVAIGSRPSSIVLRVLITDAQLHRVHGAQSR